MIKRHLDLKIRKWQVIYLGDIMRKEDFETLKLTRHTETSGTEGNSQKPI